MEKNRVSYTVEKVDGRDVKKVLVQDNELLSSDSETSPVESNVVGVATLPKKSGYDEIEDVVTGRQDQILELLRSMYEDNRNLAERAGQAKLLTDSESKTKEEYFKVIQENATLKAKIEMLQQQLEETGKKDDAWWKKL
ncbi:MAG: hypothetical protein AB1782_06000 [Cyanobacteriota bacterium]